MRGLELTRSGIAATVVVLVVVALCIRLGLWQLDRRDQRLERNAAMAERLAAPPAPLGGMVVDTVGLVHRSTAVTGRYDNDRSIVLAGRSHRGVPGVHIFTPLRFEDGSGAILVNRGWLHAPDAVSADLARLRRPHTATVRGILMAFPDVRVDPGDAAFRVTWFRLDGRSIAAQYPYPVAPVYLLATDTAGADAAVDDGGSGLVEPVRQAAPTLDGGPHLSYAVQWFSFAAIFAVGWAVLALRSRSTAPRTG